MMDQDKDQEKAAQDAERALLQDVQEKARDYPSLWEPIYKRCKAHEDFALLGKIFDEAERRRLKISSNARIPNLLKTYVNNQANSTLQHKYKCVISPNGGGSDVTKARMRGQVLRGIQVPTCGPVYNAARRGQLAAGIHYSKVVVDYASDRGFEKTFRYEDVADTYNVFPDPYVNTPTFCDMRDFLIREEVPKALWKEKTGQDFGHSNEKRRTVWYFWRKRESRTEMQYLMQDGTEKLASELDVVDGQPDMSQVQMDGDTPFGRDVSVYDWEWFIISDDFRTVYKQGVWLGCYPPLVACTGERIVEVMGKETQVYYVPLTADAEEPAQMYAQLEFIIKMRLARSPFSKWKVAFESILTKETKDLREASILGDLDVLYKAFDERGNAIPPPVEQEPFILDKLLVELQQVQIQKIERILGIFDAALGQKTNEKSGVAIKERKQQSDLSNYHFTFNFFEYVKQMGMCTLEAFPHYLTTMQQVAFMDEDDKAVMQMVNTPGGVTFDPNERYSMVVEAQPDSDTDREAEAEGLMEMMNNKLLGELIVSTPGAPALIVKAQKGRYAQQIGSMMEQSAQDPQRRQLAQQLQQAMRELEDLKRDRSLEAMKEDNRHREKIAELMTKQADNADKNEIAAFNAETSREKVNGIPQEPNSILEGADAIV